jgi:hypothetical protein
VQRRILLGTYALSAGYYDAYYVTAQRARTRIRREYEAAFYPADPEWRRAVLVQSREIIDRGIAGISSS